MIIFSSLNQMIFPALKIFRLLAYTQNNILIEALLKLRLDEEYRWAS
jgi:hypothetical protein